MARNQIIYNVEDVFIGPCPASGYHFINYSGQLNNDYQDFPSVSYESFQYKSPNPAVIHTPMPKDKNQNTFARNHNLLKRLERIQNISYQVNSSRTIINQIGKAASVDRIYLNKPEVNLTFSYILSSLKNEARMGFNVNHPRLEYPYTGDKYFYRTDNEDPLFLFSGFLDRSYAKEYPFSGARGEGIGVNSPCFERIQPTPTPNPNFVSNYIPFYVGKHINPLFRFITPESFSLSAGFYHSLALVTGKITGWGDNNEGQLVNYISENNSFDEFTGNWSNTIVGELTGVKKISTNYLHNLAILSNDKITGWGANDEGQAVGTTGYNDNNYLFTGNWNNAPINQIHNVTDISAGAYHSIAVYSNNHVTGWGDNTYGQALSGNILTGIERVSAGGYHTIALKINGTITGWGDDEYNQSSKGNILTGVKQISAGHLHSFALLENGTITGWGWNDDGQVAGTKNFNNNNGVFTGNWENTPVGKLRNVKSIHAGWFHTLALLNNTKITGWGSNHAGQINRAISYNDSNGIFTGDWNSTVVGSFELYGISTSYQHTAAFIQGRKNETISWGEDSVSYDVIDNDYISNVSEYNEYDCVTKDPYWPLTTKDKRNIFIAISEDQSDYHETNLYENFSLRDEQTFINRSAYQKAPKTRTIGFGNCYLNSYRQSASVGNFVVAEVNYLAENMIFQMSGSGANTPYVDPKTYTSNTGIKFNIPYELDKQNATSALLPGDINVKINSSGYGLDLDDVRIQGYDFSFQFNRENLDAIGYKLPLDREINLPLIVNVSFDINVGEQKYSDLAYLITEDKDYDLFIDCKNRCDYDPNFSWTPLNQSSIFEKRFENLLSCQFFNCKFEGISFGNQIGGRKTAKLNFSTEIDPEDYTRGMQISGLLGIEKIEDFLLVEDDGSSNGNYLIQEDGELLVSNLSVLY